MGILRTDPDKQPPTYSRRCKECGEAFDGERIGAVLDAVHEHTFSTGHRQFLRQDRQRDPMENVRTSSLSALGPITNRAEPRDKDKRLRVVRNRDDA